MEVGAGGRGRYSPYSAEDTEEPSLGRKCCNHSMLQLLQSTSTSTAISYAVSRAIPTRSARGYMCSMMLSPNSEHLISVAPVICRAKSYVTRFEPIAPLRPLTIKSATSSQPK